MAMRSREEGKKRVRTSRRKTQESESESENEKAFWPFSDMDETEKNLKQSKCNRTEKPCDLRIMKKREREESKKRMIRNGLF